MKLHRVILPVDDIEDAAKLYGRLFEQEGRRVSPGRHYFGAGGVTLALYDALADGDEAPGDPLTEPLYFAVEDIEAAHARCGELGFEFNRMELPKIGKLGEIETRPWGERSFYVMDPSGNPLCFVEASGARGA